MNARQGVKVQEGQDLSERKDWKRLHRTHACKDDSTNRFPTPKDVVKGLV